MVSKASIHLFIPRTELHIHSCIERKLAICVAMNTTLRACVIDSLAPLPITSMQLFVSMKVLLSRYIKMNQV